MKVRMVSTQRGSEDGVQVDTHKAGEVYDLGADLAGVYVREGWAVEEGARPATPKPPSVQLAEAADRLNKPAKNTAQKAPQRRKASGK